MKRTADGAGWAHITCVIWINETGFQDAEHMRDVVGVDLIPKARWRLKCQLCKSRARIVKPPPAAGATGVPAPAKSASAPTAKRARTDDTGCGVAIGQGGYTGSAPIQCSTAMCVQAFHPLCARAANWQMQITETAAGDARPKAYCGRHSSTMLATGETDPPCVVCRSTGREDKMLLCDECDKGYHTDCLSPPLASIPDGDWFCKKCLKKRLRAGTVVAVPALSKGAGAGAGTGAGAGVGAGAGADAGKGTATASRTQFVSLTDEFVSSLPAPPALMSSDSEADGDGPGGGALSSSDTESEPEPSTGLGAAKRRVFKPPTTPTFGRSTGPSKQAAAAVVASKQRRREASAAMASAQPLGMDYFTAQKAMAGRVANAALASLELPSDADAAATVASLPSKHALSEKVLRQAALNK